MMIIRKQKGFTLVELLVTISVISILTTLAVTAVRFAQSRAKVSRAQHDIDTIFGAMGFLANDCGAWPGVQPLEILCVDRVGGCPNGNEICGDGCTYGLFDDESGLLSTDGSYTGWSGPYLKKVLEDPWGNEYFFDSDYRVNVDNEPCGGGGGCADAVVLGSYGPDGLGNNQYNSDDIIKIIYK